MRNKLENFCLVFQNKFYIETKLNRDLKDDLIKLFTEHVAEKHIYNLMRKYSCWIFLKMERDRLQILWRSTAKDTNAFRYCGDPQQIGMKCQILVNFDTNSFGAWGSVTHLSSFISEVWLCMKICFAWDLGEPILYFPLWLSLVYQYIIFPCDLWLWQNECLIVLLFMLLLFNFIIRILTGVIKKVVWSKNCAASVVTAMMCWGCWSPECCQQFVPRVNANVMCCKWQPQELWREVCSCGEPQGLCESCCPWEGLCGHRSCCWPAWPPEGQLAKHWGSGSAVHCSFCLCWGSSALLFPGKDWERSLAVVSGSLRGELLGEGWVTRVAARSGSLAPTDRGDHLL